MKRHHELGWHRQCQHSRYRRDHVTAAAKRVAKRRKAYSYGFGFNDGVLIALVIVIGALLWLDAFVPGGSLS